MSSAPFYALAAAVGLALALALGLARRRKAKREQAARGLARELVPEIRALIESSDPHGATEGRPADPLVYRRRRDELDALVSPECHYAVELFYRAVEAYDAALQQTREAFRDDSEVGLGDRIRAKDYRDRCLKDVYFTGEAAVQKLEKGR